MADLSVNFAAIKSPIILLIAFLQLSGCHSFRQTDLKTQLPENVQMNIAQEKVVDSDLEQNRRLWSEKGITDYNVIINEASKGGNVSYPSPALIEVRHNKAVSISVNSKSDESLRERYKEIDTIDKMFDIIQQGYEKGAKVEVKYNKTFGYPEYVSVDDVKHGVDSWIIIKIGKLEIIK